MHTNKPHTASTLETLESRQLLSGDINTIALDMGATPESVIFADFTGDGVTDTAALVPESNTIQIWSRDSGEGYFDPFFEWGTIEGDFADAQRLQVLDVNADGMIDLGFFDAGTKRFTTYINNGDSTFTFAGGLQLADTATGIVLIYDAEGPIAEPVGPWIGSEDFGADREGFGEGGDDYGDGGGDYGDGGDDYGGGDGAGGDNFGDASHFVGDPFIAVWHDSLGALQIVDSLLLLGRSDGSGDSGDGNSDGTENAIAWPFDGAYIDMPTGIYFATGSGGDAMAIMDFDNDDSPDIAVTNRDDDTVSIISFQPEYQDLMAGGFNLEDGLIETDTFDVGDQPVHINAFDINLDGFMDMIVSNAGDGTFSILHGSEAGLGDLETIDVAPGVTQAFLNFNAFGHELFVLGFSADGTITQLDFVDGTLEIAETEAGFLLANDQALPRQQIVGEFDGDGFIDIAVIDQAGGQVVIYSNVTGDADDGDDEDDYGGPPIDSRDIPIPGIPDLIDDSDTGESNTDDVTAYNNAGEFTLSFDVRVSHVSDDLDDLRTTLNTFFEENGEQFDDNGFAYTPSIWINLFAGNVYIGSAEVSEGDTVVTVETDGTTVLREGTHQIRAGFAIGAPGLRGLIGTRSGNLGIEVRVPRVEVEVPDDEGETVTITRDESGKPVLSFEQQDGEKEQLHLADFDDLPEITGSVVTMREANSRSNASRYAAARSDEGLVLFVRDQEGAWDGRNLTDEITDAEPITDSNISVLITPWGNVNMAGLNEQGELIFYWQNGGVDENGEATWNFVNLADDQLRENGESVPSFTSALTSFVTPWGAMNVAGLDTDGHLRVIWWAPGADHWISTDLTELLGSTPLTGDIAAWVTPWGGINITGLNTDGEMVAVWWAPGGEWTVTPLGDNLGAPAFVAGSLTSFIADSGETFIAGITVTGDVGVFTWTPGDSAWTFAAIDNLPESATLIGSVSGYYTSDNNSVTLLVGSLDGSIYQLGSDAGDIQNTWDVGLFAA
ncbi:MAG: hypothetical protein Q9O74_07370 [Planctomycetota bacterium]|nr:hypothetical protein [Planctomycetota bacterium]